MAGGVGSRFWPVSRTAFPKQFTDFFGVGKTLIQSTYDRFANICPPENIFIVTNEIYVDLIKAQIPALSPNQILAEPIMRNTAPCIAYGSMKIAEINPNAVIVVAPSDHTIANQDGFIQAINQSLKAAAENNWKEVGQIAHKLKSTFGNMGVNSMVPHVVDLETQTGDPHQLIEKLDVGLEKVFAQMKADYPDLFTT